MPLAAACLAALLLAAAAWRDVATRLIPDSIGLLLAGLGLGVRAVQGLAPLGGSVAAAGALFLVLLLLHARGLLGGGDVKLAGALALGLPPELIWDFVVATAAAGGVLALLYLLLQRLAPTGPHRPRRLLPRVLAAEAWRLRRRAPLPYAVAIGAGGGFVLFTGG